MKIAIIGQQDFGKAALEAFLARGDEVAGVFCQPDKEGAKPDALREAAAARNVPVFQFKGLRSAPAQDALRALNVDLGVMAYVLQFAPQEFVNIPRHGTIQYHPSLLPLHRGPSSINWPISLGAKETGLTIFRPTDGLDEGPVILQKSCAIGPDETLGEVYFNKLFPMGVAALLEAADLVVAGKHTETVQDESKATYEGWFQEEESRINWANHVDVVYNLIRACNPAPGAWTMLGGVKTWIYDCRKITMGKFTGAHRPGDIHAVSDTSLTIKAQGGMIEVLKLRAEGGKKMNAGEWARANGITPA
ncbi:methionyl-tRNA formyltransferase [Caenimonas koreensis]|uniref:methionyl-tRNA formyltransferase n=1 Tax=Caenimonas koreensis TaxID=367474 RepID=UPI003784E4B8